MTAPLDRLSGIRAYVEAATKEPWVAESRGWKDGSLTIRCGKTDELGYEHHSEANAQFIARARTDLPLLLAVTTAVAEYIAELDGPEGVANDDEIRAALDALSEQA